MIRIRVKLKDRYIEGVMRELGALGIAHMIDYEETRKYKYKKRKEEEGAEIEEDVLGRCFELVKRIQNLIDLIEWQRRELYKSETRSKIEFHLDESDFGEMSFQERLNTIENDLVIMEKLIPISKKDLEHLLRKEVVITLDRNVLDLFDERKIKREWFGVSRFLYVIGGLINSGDFEKLEEILEEITEGDYFILKEDLRDEYEGKILVRIVTLSEYKDELDEFIGVIPYIGVSYGDISYEHLLVMRELINRERYLALQIRKSIGDLGPLTEKTDKEYVFEGWVPKKDAEQLIGKINETSQGSASIDTREPKMTDDVPILLDNPSIIKPFETIVEMFGLPSYNEIDPTLILAVTSPLLFGLMFGDVGHGISISLIGLLLYLFPKNSRYRNFGFIIIACALMSIIFGFLYGSFFGRHDIIDAIWLRPSIRYEFLALVFTVGIVHMSLGLVLDIMNRISSNVVRDEGINWIISLIDPISRLLLFFGGIFLLWGHTKIGQPGAIIVCAITFILPLLLMSSKDAIQNVMEGKKERILEDIGFGAMNLLHTIITLSTNIVSYIRILVLALVHDVSGWVVLTISGVASNTPMFGGFMEISIIVLGTLIIISLEGTIIFIQSVRLHYYEFFNKFYQGTGTRYEPFRIA